MNPCEKCGLFMGCEVMWDDGPCALVRRFLAMRMWILDTQYCGWPEKCEECGLAKRSRCFFKDFADEHLAIELEEKS